MRWEYTTLGIRIARKKPVPVNGKLYAAAPNLQEEAEAGLESLGEQGWELVSVIPFSSAAFFGNAGGSFEMAHCAHAQSDLMLPLRRQAEGRIEHGDAIDPGQRNAQPRCERPKLLCRKIAMPHLQILHHGDQHPVIAVIPIYDFFDQFLVHSTLVLVRRVNLRRLYRDFFATHIELFSDLLDDRGTNT